MNSSFNLYKMIGRVRQAKPNISSRMATDFINDRIREVLNYRPHWSDLIRKGVLAIPDAYSTGTISTTTGSSVAAGAATAWPVSDVLLASLPNGVPTPGPQEVLVAQPPTGTITSDSYILVDPGSPQQEAVAVLRYAGARITANFQNSHGPNTAIQASSLAGQQISVAGGAVPIFTILAVDTPTSLELDNPWGGPPLAASTYQILQRYVTLAVDLKAILEIVDPLQGTSLEFHQSQSRLNFLDPQRTSFGDPEGLFDLGPNACGNMQYELWPAPVTARQIGYLYSSGWPELNDNGDVPPWFIDPMVFVNGAIATALRTRIIGSRLGPDPYYDMKLADIYESKYAQGIQLAINADESKVLQAYQAGCESLYGSMGANSRWALSHVGSWDF